MKYLKIIIIALSLCMFQNSKADLNRLIVLTDVENEPDDAMSLVRLMMYSNQLDIEGIIATTSTHMRDGIHPETIHKTIKAYGKVRDNLMKHEQGWPTEEYLHSITLPGSPTYGMTAVGEGKDCEGSELIINALKKDDPRPLWVTAWGGVNTLAQALYKLKNTCKPKELAKLLSKLRVYTISDQDDAGIWIRKNFPTVFYVVSPGGYGNATWTGINAADTNTLYRQYVSNKWIANNIQQGHGPLGECYPDVAYGMEGDTPSFLGLIPNGLSDMEHPNYGGWGGRYEYYKPKYEDLDINGFNGGVPIEDEPHAIWTNAIDSLSIYIYNSYGVAVKKSVKRIGGFTATIFRWRDAFQNDFAARMDWCTKPYEEANHAPVPVLSTPEKMTVKSGDVIYMDASDSYDPDGDNISYLWFNYPEAGTYDKEVDIVGSPNIHHVKAVAPTVKKETTLHFILQVTDKGTPRMTRYKRIIVTVKP